MEDPQEKIKRLLETQRKTIEAQKEASKKIETDRQAATQAETVLHVQK